MKAKRFVAIGLLTAAAIALVGCAIVLGKNKNAYKPKTQEVSAAYDFTTYNPTNDTWTITGNTNPTNNDEVGYNFQTVFAGTYTITKTATNLTITYNINKMYSAHNGTTYTYNVNYTNTQIFTQNEIPTNLNAISLEIAEINRRYETEDATYYYEVGLYYLLKGDTNQSRYYYWNIPEQQNVYINQSDYGYILDYITLATTNTIENAYQTGWTAGNQGNQDIVDIRGLMLNILTMPFTFISQAFDVTLWEGTPYAFNISNFIKGMIAIATILFIIKLFTSGFSIIGNYTGGAGEKISRWRMNRSQRQLNRSKAALNNRTDPNHKTIKKE